MIRRFEWDNLKAFKSNLGFRLSAVCNVIYLQNTKLCSPIRFVRVDDLISWTLTLENRKIKLDFLPENKNLFVKSKCWEICHMSSEMMPLML